MIPAFIESVPNYVIQTSCSPIYIEKEREPSKSNNPDRLPPGAMQEQCRSNVGAMQEQCRSNAGAMLKIERQLINWLQPYIERQQINGYSPI